MRHPLARTALGALLWACLTSDARARDRELYVINSLAETLSRVNLATGAVSNNIRTLGLAPNQIFIDNERRRDGLGYVTNSVSNTLQIIDLKTAANVRTIPLGADRNPYSLTFLNDSMVAVTNLLAGTLSEVDTRNGLVRSEYPVGPSPEGIVQHRGLLYVCLTAFDFGTFSYGQGQVAVVDPERDSVLKRIDVGTNPQAALIDYQNQLLVLCTGDFLSVFGRIYVIDPAALAVVDSIATGGFPGHFALSPTGRVYIAAGGFAGPGQLYIFDSHGHVMLRGAADPVAVGTGALAAATDLAGHAYSCDFSVDRISKLAFDSVVASFALGDGPGFAAVYEPFGPGDADQSGAVDAADLIFLVNYIFKNGPGPALLALGDVNRSCTITAADLVWLVNRVFKSGPAPRYGCY